jgi:hypothetical protein
LDLLFDRLNRQQKENMFAEFMVNGLTDHLCQKCVLNPRLLNPVLERAQSNDELAKELFDALTRDFGNLYLLSALCPIHPLKQTDMLNQIATKIMLSESSDADVESLLLQNGKYCLCKLIERN